MQTSPTFATPSRLYYRREIHRLVTATARLRLQSLRLKVRGNCYKTSKKPKRKKLTIQAVNYEFNEAQN
jgi:hypothetical protein